MRRRRHFPRRNGHGLRRRKVGEETEPTTLLRNLMKEHGIGLNITRLVCDYGCPAKKEKVYRQDKAWTITRSEFDAWLVGYRKAAKAAIDKQRRGARAVVRLNRMTKNQSLLDSLDGGELDECCPVFALPPPRPADKVLNMLADIRDDYRPPEGFDSRFSGVCG